MKKLIAALLAAFAFSALAQGNLEVDAPVVASLKTSMQGRFPELEGHFASGAIGLSRDGRIEPRK